MVVRVGDVDGAVGAHRHARRLGQPCRVDLKADRRNGALMVMASFAEPDAPPETASELAAELDQLKGWLALESIVVHPRGDLAPELAVEVKGL